MSSVHVGVDSAAPHIAAAVGTPTVTIYGPTDWRDWAPVGKQHRVVVPQMDCIPCHQDGMQRPGAKPLPGRPFPRFREGGDYFSGFASSINMIGISSLIS